MSLLREESLIRAETVTQRAASDVPSSLGAPARRARRTVESRRGAP